MPGFANFLDKVKTQAANVGQQASAFAQVRVDRFPPTDPRLLLPLAHELDHINSVLAGAYRGCLANVLGGQLPCNRRWLESDAVFLPAGRVRQGRQDSQELPRYVDSGLMCLWMSSDNSRSLEA